MANELFAVLVALNVVDAYLTLKVLKRGGRELNPLLRWAMQEVGAKPALIGFKVLMLGVIYWLLPVPDFVLMILIGIYALACWHNARQ